jgi:hypothetical protein
MKRMFLGGLMFFSGFTGVLVLVCISIFKPWVYNGVNGFRGFLLGTDTELFFVLYCILGVIGMMICLFESYKKSNTNN